MKVLASQIVSRTHGMEGQLGSLVLSMKVGASPLVRHSMLTVLYTFRVLGDLNFGLNCYHNLACIICISLILIVTRFR